MNLSILRLSVLQHWQLMEAINNKDEYKLTEFIKDNSDHISQALWDNGFTRYLHVYEFVPMGKKPILKYPLLENKFVRYLKQRYGFGGKND